MKDGTRRPIAGIPGQVIGFAWLPAGDGFEIKHLLRAAETASKQYLSTARSASANANKFGDGHAVDVLNLGKAAVPDNAAILGELGWALFLLGEKRGDQRFFPDAERETRAALATNPTRHQAAAFNYNLGRIAEALHFPEKARNHYKRSLELRPSETVSKRLKGLDYSP